MILLKYNELNKFCKELILGALIFSKIIVELYKLNPINSPIATDLEKNKFLKITLFNLFAHNRNSLIVFNSKKFIFSKVILFISVQL